MNELLTAVKSKDDILPDWRGTPISDLLAYQNLEQSHRVHDNAELVIIMCMDHRKVLRIPERFAYVLRVGGGNPGRVQFEISYAIAVGGARAVALIAHDECGMVGLNDRRKAFVEGLVQVGWKYEQAEEHFQTQVQHFDIFDPLEFVNTESKRLQKSYPNITVAPLFYSLKEGLLYQV